MVLRNGHDAVEVLMLRRSLASKFVSGAYVFPGGAVDPEDGEDEMLERCTGRSAGEANTLLDLDSGALCYWVSAFRECFEEAGVLVATGPDGDPLTFEDPGVEARFVEHRRALNAGQRTFLDVCRAEGLTLPAGSVHYVGHWITPEGAPRRYDTRFFVAMEPPGQTAVHDEVETIDHMWVTPAEALEQFDAGTIDLVLPTIWNLRMLARYASTAELLASLSAVGEVPTVRPVLVVDDRGRTRVITSLDPTDVVADVQNGARDG